MRITIAGVGHAGTTVGADLSHKGHEVTLLKTSNKLHNEHYRHLRDTRRVVMQEKKEMRHVDIHNVTDDFHEALEAVDLIIIYTQTNYHEPLIEKLLPFLRGGEVILIEPGYLSTAYFASVCEELGLAIIEAESSPIDCRITEPGKVEVLFRNVRNPIGVYPRVKRDFAMTVLSDLGYNFVLTKSVVEAALHNPNLIVHTVGAIMSMPRIECSKGDYWMYREVFTPSVWNIVERLDEEKMSILSALGYDRLPYVEACRLRNSEPQDVNALEVFFDYARNSAPKGPSEVDSRYITEDVPEGLVLMESLGSLLGVETPVCSALVSIASAGLGIQFRSIGRTTDKLGKENILKILNDK